MDDSGFTTLYDGSYARIGDRIGVIRETRDEASDLVVCGNGWRRFVLRPLRRQEFRNIPIKRNAWPSEDDVLDSETMLNIVLRFTVVAGQAGVLLRSSTEFDPDEITASAETVQHQFTLKADVFYVFIVTMLQLHIDGHPGWRDIAFFRLFGREYEESRKRFKHSGLQ